MNGNKPDPKKSIDRIGKFVGGAMGLIFAGIGLTVLIFLWANPFGEFDSPPLFFRVFASFIALSFVIIGGSIFLMSIMVVKVGNNILQSINEAKEQEESSTDEAGVNTPTYYTCQHCGAPLGKGVEVSPRGDVKCVYCNAWFNIYGK
jgi:hypothetical protein